MIDNRHAKSVKAEAATQVNALTDHVNQLKGENKQLKQELKWFKKNFPASQPTTQPTTQPAQAKAGGK